MTAHQNSKQKKVVLLIATLTSFLNPFLASSVTVALPSIGMEFGMGPVLLGWVNTSFLLAIAPFMIPFGRLGDIHGRKKIFLFGSVLLIAASGTIPLSPSGTVLILCRALQGFASAMIVATINPILISSIIPSERGNVLGIVTAALYSGLSAGPFIGGVMTNYLGWRFIFWFHLSVTLITTVIAHLLLEGDRRGGQKDPFDLVGTAILASGLFALMYGFSILPDAFAAILITLGLAVIAGFVAFEMHRENPIVDITLFRYNPVFAFSNLAALINYAATFAVGFLLSLYLQKVRFLSPQAAGLVLVAQPILQSLCSPISGRLSDRMEPRFLASGGMAVTVLGSIMLIFLGTQSTILYIVLCQIMLGIGFGFFTSPNLNALLSSVDHGQYGIANATLATMRQIGMMLSMGIVMMSMSLFMGNAEIEPPNTGQFLTSLHYAFGIFALLCAGGIWASMARGDVRGKEGGANPGD